MHYYQHNIGDYARDTGHLTILEHGIYRLLLDWCYLNEKPITTEQAIRVGRGNPVETQSVISEFFSLSDDGWVHKRVAQEVADYHKKAVKNRVNGAKGGRPKPNNNPVGSQTDAKHNPNQEPLTINQEPIKKTARGTRLPENFEPDFVFGVDAGIQNTLEEAAKFRDYWNSQPGQKGVKLDWDATWRNWCRNVKPSSKVQQSSETPYQRSMREKYQTIAPSIAAQNPNVQRIDVNTFFDTLPAKKLEITNG